MNVRKVIKSLKESKNNEKNIGKSSRRSNANEIKRSYLLDVILFPTKIIINKEVTSEYSYQLKTTRKIITFMFQ